MKTVGIDLGTTNSVVAVMEGGKPKVIPSKEGRNIIPSVVDPINRVVGDIAKRQMVIKPKQVVFSVKRLMGHKMTDPDIEEDKKWLPYTIKAGKEGRVILQVEEKTFTPEEISAMILSKAKADAEDYLGEKVEKAVITVPAYFDDAQRQATKQAGEIAGLEVVRVINEPTASALAYGLDKQQLHNIAVYDFGGGTFDITILELGEGVFQVKATRGDTHLGGDDFDKEIISYLVEEFKKEQGIDLSKDPQALQRLKEAAEKAKIELSSSLETEINLPFITVKDGNPLHFVIKMTRAKLESLTNALIERSFEPVKECLKDAKMEAKNIDEVILVGGMTRMPKIKEKVKEYFGKEPNMSVNPDEAVALGAAIQAGILGGEVKDVVLLDVTPLTLGVETLGGVMTPLITRNTSIPTSKSEVFSTAADNQTQVDIHILQGERPMATDNKSLGRFILEGIPPAPRGVPQVEVTFDLDANGILQVTAKDKATGKSQSIKITGSTGLSKDEVEKIRTDAESHAAEDEKIKESIEARNQADSLIYTAEKSLKDEGDKIKPELKTEVEEKIKALKDILGKADKDEISKKTQELSESLQKIGQEAYKNNQAQPEKESSDKKAEDDKKSPDTDGKVEEGEVVEES
ncbi:molecular chaperone DnaK [Candidatus Roizmanbacteria bacterium RIFCSPHIGHO2_01_FULL_39_12b]|uniref:Chaperone protein DnaK n=1 Tax=Candidatus Roizmanbacteria bacterium RIFCSPHIGHO2_01_FULL_39_12b TaxID=1802030 RepID=A0A1F7GB14_9BACT|nr:MAG: molecular chaperone DnaK [Candidatus Roizmanbacteria bacterium RIFCSPHIGHO2_01_FULL_39_12b]OGK46116.1 MAG: molecular chaperone DnaK [Candidatus Roizmanbacteria bacterium RIFCSPLOWO2_01_FULL_39_19]